MSFERNNESLSTTERNEWLIEFVELRIQYIKAILSDELNGVSMYLEMTTFLNDELKKGLKRENPYESSNGRKYVSDMFIKMNMASKDLYKVGLNFNELGRLQFLREDLKDNIDKDKSSMYDFNEEYEKALNSSITDNPSRQEVLKRSQEEFFKGVFEDFLSKEK